MRKARLSKRPRTSAEAYAQMDRAQAAASLLNNSGASSKLGAGKIN